jgi:hypothetical protein
MKVHSFTLSYILGSMRWDSRASLFARNLASPCFGREPKVRVTTTIMHCCCLLRLNTTRKEGNGNKLSCLFCCNNTTKENDGIIGMNPKYKGDKTHKFFLKKAKEGKELTFKLLLCPFTFDSHFYPFVLTFFHGIFFFSSREKKKKNHRKKK